MIFFSQRTEAAVSFENYGNFQMITDTLSLQVDLQRSFWNNSFRLVHDELLRFASRLSHFLPDSVDLCNY